MFTDAIVFEDPNFEGTNECKYAEDPIKTIKVILGIQEKIEGCK